MTVSGPLTTHGIPKFADTDVPDLGAGGVGTIVDTLDGLIGAYKLSPPVVLGGSAASIGFSSLPTSGYSALLLALYLRGDTASSDDQVCLRFNGDSGNNYTCNDVGISGTPGLGGGGAAPFSSITIGWMPAANSPANSFSATLVWIPFYANTAAHKAVAAFGFDDETATTSGVNMGLAGGRWENAAAVNQLTIFGRFSANLVANSRVAIWGLP